jgi:hypothetical protein
MRKTGGATLRSDRIMTEGNRDPLSSPLSLTDQQQRRSGEMETAVPGRSETLAVRSPLFATAEDRGVQSLRFATAEDRGASREKWTRPSPAVAKRGPARLSFRYRGGPRTPKPPFRYRGGPQRQSGEMDTAVPGRSETRTGAALFSLPRRTAGSKASVSLPRRTAAPVGRNGHGRPRP